MKNIITENENIFNDNSSNKYSKSKDKLILEINSIFNPNSEENNYLLSPTKAKQSKLINPNNSKKNTEHNNIEENKIICFSRRRKCPKSSDDLCGYFVTMSFFLIFTILNSLCLHYSKNISEAASYIPTLHNWLIFFIVLTSIISMISLTDGAMADPGKQRGYPISEKKFKSAKIKKIVGGEKFTLKYCYTCHLIRDIRTFHCSICDICIEKHDHHCNYLSNCVGVYNYRKFFCFIIIACIHVTIMLITCFLFIINFVGKDMKNYEWTTIIIAITLMFALFFEIFTVWMIVQHIQTIAQNRTTREFIKNREYGIYNKGCKENCKEALCNNKVREY
jgi:hypothetical protein